MAPTVTLSLICPRTLPHLTTFSYSSKFLATKRIYIDRPLTRSTGSRWMPLLQWYQIKESHIYSHFHYSNYLPLPAILKSFGGLANCSPSSLQTGAKFKLAVLRKVFLCTEEQGLHPSKAQSCANHEARYAAILRNNIDKTFCAPQVGA